MSSRDFSARVTLVACSINRLGRWSGFANYDSSGSEDTSRRKILLTFLFREPSESEGSSSSTLTFGTPEDQKGIPYTLSGTATTMEDRSIKFDITIKYSGFRMEYHGDKIEGSRMVAGSWGAYYDDPTFSSDTGSFSILQISEDVMDLLLSPRVLVWNRARLLWNLAIDFALLRVKQMSWKTLHERRMRRKQFLRLYIERKGSSLLPNDFDTYVELWKSMTVADIRYYQSLGDLISRTTPEHV